MSEPAAGIESEPTAIHVAEALTKPPGNESISDRLRKRRQEVAEATTIDVDIPGYDGELFARYRRMNSKQLNKIVTQATKIHKDRAEAATWATCAMLADACEEFFLRIEERGEVPVREIVGIDTPVRYDQDLAELLGFKGDLPDPPTATSVVLGVFVGNDMAMAAHSQRLSRWMLTNEAETDIELLSGEA